MPDLPSRRTQDTEIETLRRELEASREALRRAREVEERFRVAFHASPDAVNLSRLEDGLLTDVNEGFTTLSGYAREEAIGRTSLDLGLWAHPEERPRLVEALRERGEVRDLETHFRAKDGSVRPGLLSARIVTIDGKAHVVSVIRDITERRRTEHALAQSEQRYRSLIENTRDGYFVADALTGRFLFLNGRACEMFGYSEAEGLALALWDVIAPEEHEELRRRVGRLLTGGPPFTPRTWAAVRKSAERLRVEVSSSLVMYEDRPVIQGLVRDVTEQERLLLRMQHAQKLEAVGTLASGVAHDFNNHLQAILGSVELLTQRGWVSAEGAPLVSQICTTVHRASELVGGLLAFARKGEPRLEPSDLNSVVAEAARILERTIPKMIRIEVAGQDDLWAVDVDPGQVQQVLLNLGANARDAMPGGGTLRVHTANAEVGENRAASLGIRPGSYVLLQVADDGAGMDARTLEHAFDPFFTTKEVGQGTGLGLAMVYGVVREHGGAVACTSTLGHGTTLKILLPARSERPVPAPPAKDTVRAASGRGERLLLVDDESAVLSIVGSALSGAGYEVTTASTAEEALALFDGGAGTDLVLLDLGMPGMGGRACLERLRAVAPHVPVVVASGYAGEDQRLDVLAGGAVRFLPKPCPLADLMACVRETLDSCSVGDTIADR